MRLLSISIHTALLLATTTAFTTTQHLSRPTTICRSTETSDENFDTKQTEKLLREELAERNSKVENEEQYAVIDGANVAVPEEVTTTASSLEDGDFARLVKKRAYPLFLAEKGAEILEGIVEDIQTKVVGKEPYFSNGKRRERIVVLGTGWGAASFLKDVDAEKYDVTVISPRNHFVFTPMLAGASVGTVEYRSITEPIREVR